MKLFLGIDLTTFSLSIIMVLIDGNDVSLNNLYQNSSFIFWICGISLMIWGVLTFASIRKSKDFLKSEESDLLLEKLKKHRKQYLMNCKYYHVLKVDCNNEERGIYFPCYELPIFE